MDETGEDDVITKPIEKKKRVVSETQLENLKKAREIVAAKRAEKKAAMKSPETLKKVSNELTEAQKKKIYMKAVKERMDAATGANATHLKKVPANEEYEEAEKEPAPVKKPLKKKPVIVEESESEEEVVIVKKKKPKKKTIVIEESESEEEEEIYQPAPKSTKKPQKIPQMPTKMPERNSYKIEKPEPAYFFG